MRFKILFLILSLAFTVAAAGESVKVAYVTDGDTITVIQNGKKLKVRLIGIDTPEKKANKKALKDSNRSGEDIKAIISQGKQATAFVKGILHKGDTVILEYDVQILDKYQRVLAYV